MSDSPTPFVSLGKHLKYVRELSRQTLAEASGAVEIDEQTLERIELGVERPAEEILLLLISHFNVEDHEAMQLWQMAQYESELPEQLRPEIDALEQPGKSMIMLLALDVRTLYSDGLDISYNKAGMTLNFTQAGNKADGTPVAQPVARIGMSYEQAEQVMLLLQNSLQQAKHSQKPKFLPPGDQNTHNAQNNADHELPE